MLESSIDTQVTNLIALIRRKYLSSDTHSIPFDFARKIQYFALDVISEIGLGERFGDLDDDEDKFDFVSSVEVGLTISSISLATGLSSLLRYKWIAERLGPTEKDKTGLGRLVSNTRDIITRRLQQGGMQKQPDMMASFARRGLTSEELISEGAFQVMAGADTTATSLRVIFLYLLSHPRAYAKLQAEIDAAVRDGRAPASPGVVSDVEVRKMEYLQAVIKEGMRAHPPITDAVPKRVPDEGDTVVIGGKSVFLPGGTNVSVAINALNEDKEVFGEDASEYRPERWLLEKDEGKLALMQRVHEMTFGYGKYQCLGRPVAMMEMGKAVFEVSRVACRVLCRELELTENDSCCAPLTCAWPSPTSRG